MRSFNPKLYKNLFDNWDDQIIQAHMVDEYKIIQAINNSRQKTFIDLGAGHGRILPVISPIAKNIFAIDINSEMFNELQVKAKQFSNVLAIMENINNLDLILKKQKIFNPVLLILQNTLGTIEGSYKKVLEQMRLVAKKYQGEVIVSLYRQKALKDWGLMSYWHGKAMNGEPDLIKTDLKKGLFISKTGYTSKWWRDEEIKTIKEFFQGKLIREIITETYWIFHIN